MKTTPEQDLIRKIAVITLTVLATIVVTFFAFYFIYVVRVIVLDLIIALVIAAALHPLVAYLEKKKFGRITAVLVAIFTLFILLALATSLITTPLLSEGSNLIDNAPHMIDSILHNETVIRLNDQYHFLGNISQVRDQVLHFLVGGGENAFSILGGIIGGLTSAAVIVIFVFFILVDGPEAWQRLLGYFSAPVQERVNATGGKMMKAISGYVTGNLFISLIAAVVSLIIFLICGIPYPYALAVLVGVLDLIPLVGATLATIAVGLVALSKGVGISVLVVIIMLIYQFCENHFIQPLVYSRYVKLSALLIIIATLVGAELAGIVGALLAIPAAAVIQIAVEDIFFNKDT